MPRPKKRRRIGRKPEQLIYKPAGIPLEQLGRVRLLQEELEALRLSDLLGLTQLEAAASMNVSRSTFQRLLEHARHQVALAFVEGRAIQVSGGTFDVNEQQDETPAG
jgi:uncharacterized protein